VFELAHAGHWIVNIAYFAPVVAFVGWLARAELKERRGGGKKNGA
jgi:hypothetical protein